MQRWLVSIFGSIALAVASGDIDFGTTGLSNPFFVLANSGTLKIIGGDTTEHDGFHGLGFIASNQAYAAGLKSTADFAGHSFGITQIGSPLEYSLALAPKHGIDIKNVRIIGLQSNSNVASSLIGGQIDGAIMSSANLNAVINRGGGKFLSWLDEEVHGAVAPLVGPLAAERALAQQAKKATLFAIGVAARKYPQTLNDEQEIVAALADMIIEVFALDSAVIRARKIVAAKGEAAAAPATTMAQIYAMEAMSRMETAARKIVGAVSEGDTLGADMMTLRRLFKYDPVNVIALQQKIAQHVLYRGKYSVV